MENLPIGFALKLAMNNCAMNYYSKLLPSVQNDITEYIQNATNSDEAKNRIETAVNMLSNNTTSFLYKKENTN